MRRLKACQGIGRWLEEANIAQISLNITDLDLTPIHVAFEEAKKDADQLKVAVTGSELVILFSIISTHLMSNPPVTFLDAIASLEEHWVSVSKSVSQSPKCKLRRYTLLYEYI